MSIRELIEVTIEDVSNYRYPNTSEFRTVINPILKAAGIGEILEGDRIDGLDIDDDALNIRFSYSRMQCEMSGERHLPLSVLDAEDPVEAATAWRLDQAVTTAEKTHADAVRQLERAALTLDKAKADRGDAATVPQDIGRDAALSNVQIAAIETAFSEFCERENLPVYGAHPVRKAFFQGAKYARILAATPPANVAQAAPEVASVPAEAVTCKGPNCSAIRGAGHSDECESEHAYAAGQKAATVPQDIGRDAALSVGVCVNDLGATVVLIRHKGDVKTLIYSKTHPPGYEGVALIGVPQS